MKMELKYELARRSRKVMLKGTFIANTNYKDQLDDLDWKLAAKELGDLNSIATLAQHIHYYVNGVKNAFKERRGFIDEKYGTYLLNIESMVEHCYYHLGQIVLLKKHFVLNA